MSKEHIGKAKKNLESLMEEHIPKHDQDDDGRHPVKKPKKNHLRGRRQLAEYIEEDDSDESEGEAAGHIDKIDQTAIEAHIVKFKLA